MGPPIFWCFQPYPPPPFCLADWLRLGLGINRDGALQSSALGLFNRVENIMLSNGACCNSLAEGPISFRVSCMGSLLPLSVSLSMSISRKAKADRGL